MKDMPEVVSLEESILRVVVLGVLCDFFYCNSFVYLQSLGMYLMESTIFCCQECLFIGPLPSNGYMRTIESTALAGLVLLRVPICGVAKKCVYISYLDQAFQVV
jgi:hypothetical protein